MTNFIAMIPMLPGIGSLLAWLLPTHCLHSLGILSPLQRAFRQCVENVQAMWSELTGHLLACLVPTDCLRSLGDWPSFHRAFRQSVGNPEAICSLYENDWQETDGNYAFEFGSFYTDFLRWTCQPFLPPLKQIEMATVKGVSSDKITNDPAYEHTRENMFSDLTSSAKGSEMQSRLFTALKRALSADMMSKRGEHTVTNGDQMQLRGFNFNVRVSLRSYLFAKRLVTIDHVTGQAIIMIASFVPSSMPKGATGSTHFRIVEGAGTVNFEAAALPKLINIRGSNGVQHSKVCLRGVRASPCIHSGGP